MQADITTSDRCPCCGQPRRIAHLVDLYERSYRLLERLVPELNLPFERAVSKSATDLPLVLTVVDTHLWRVGREAMAAIRPDMEPLDAIRTAPDDPEHHFLAGLVASRASRADEARTHYQAAIAKAEGAYPEAYFNLGILEKNNSNPDAAIAAYTKAIELRPTYQQAWNNLGLVHAAARRPVDAEAAFRQALGEDSGTTTVQIKNVVWARPVVVDAPTRVSIACAAPISSAKRACASSGVIAMSLKKLANRSLIWVVLSGSISSG